MELLLENCREIRMRCPAKYTLKGFSVAGNRTGFIIPELKIMFDAGVRTNKSIKAAFITHSHPDHTGELPFIIKCRYPKNVPVIMPAEAVGPIRKYEEAIQNMSTGTVDDLGDDVWNIQKIEPIVAINGTIMNLDCLKDMNIEVMPAYHTAQSHGYGFSTVKTKLKQGIDKTKIMELKKQGANIFEQIETPQFVFYSDTTVKALERDKWKKYPVVIIETTAYPPLESDTHGMHMHWNDIKPIIENNSSIYFILIHHSCSLKDEYLKEFQENSGIDNFEIWINS